MVTVIVTGGVVQAVYSDKADELVKVLDFEEEVERGQSVEQIQAEADRIAREMHPVY